MKRVLAVALLLAAVLATGATKVKRPAETIFTVAVTSDVTVDSTTAVNAGDLFFSVDAWTYYGFEFYVQFQSLDATTEGIGISVNGPAANFVSYIVTIAVDTTTSITNNCREWDQFPAVTASVDAADATLPAVIRGSVYTGSVGGTINLRFRAETDSGNDVSIKAGSYGILRVM